MEFTAWQRELIAESRVARLATIGRAGQPALLPVCYAVADDRFVIAIDEKPKTGRPLARLLNIERDPRVSLLIDRYDDDWERLAWVRVEGPASVLAAGAMFPEALAALRTRYPQYRAMALEQRPLIVITPARVVAWRWRDASGRDVLPGRPV